MKQTVIVALLLISEAGFGVGCKSKKTAPAPAPQTASQPDSTDTIVQDSTGKCSVNVVSIDNQGAIVQSSCPDKGQHNVTKTDSASVGTITQSSTGDNSVNIVSAGRHGVVVVDTDNDGFKSPRGKILFVCDDGSKPADGICTDGRAPEELHLADRKY